MGIALAAWRIRVMKRLIACALVATSLVLSVQAKPKDDKDNEKYEDKDKGGQVYSVPDAGSSAMLLGLAFLAVAALHRKRAIA
jgi:VPDSG-CTERM motif